VGLVSLGLIGRLVRERLRPFDLRVLAYDPYVKPDYARELDVQLLPLAEVFRRSDVVSLHTPLREETEKMITGAHFASMKPGATFINTARGAIVHETEMIEVLKQRPDLQAVLDVTYPEPPEPGSPLYTLPNVILTPHIAGSMDGECRRMGRYMVEELRRFVAGKPLRWQVTREAGTHKA
jgi:phosphoglycerate dehydrogenase-like enzyme